MQLLIKAASDKKLQSKIPGLMVEEEDVGSDDDEKNLILNLITKTVLKSIKKKHVVNEQQHLNSTFVCTSLIDQSYLQWDQI